ARAHGPYRVRGRALRVPDLQDRLRGGGPRDVDRAVGDHRQRVDEGGRARPPSRRRGRGPGRRGVRGPRPMSAPGPIEAGDRRRGRLLVAAAAVCWSGGGLMARLVDTDPWTTVFWRGVFCASFLAVVTALRERADTPRVLAAMGATGLGVAVCFAIGSTCFIMALDRTAVANVLIIQSLSPFMAGLRCCAWLGEVGASPRGRAMGGGAAG